MSTNMKYYEYITNDLDRWDLIAYKFYGNALKIDPIIAANPHVTMREITPYRLTITTNEQSILSNTATFGEKRTAQITIKNHDERTFTVSDQTIFVGEKGSNTALFRAYDEVELLPDVEASITVVASDDGELFNGFGNFKLYMPEERIKPKPAIPGKKASKDDVKMMTTDAVILPFGATIHGYKLYEYGTSSKVFKVNNEAGIELNSEFKNVPVLADQEGKGYNNCFYFYIDGPNSDQVFTRVAMNCTISGSSINIGALSPVLKIKYQTDGAESDEVVEFITESSITAPETYTLYAEIKNSIIPGQIDTIEVVPEDISVSIPGKFEVLYKADDLGIPASFKMDMKNGHGESAQIVELSSTPTVTLDKRDIVYGDILLNHGLYTLGLESSPDLIIDVISFSLRPDYQGTTSNGRDYVMSSIMGFDVVVQDVLPAGEKIRVPIIDELSREAVAKRESLPPWKR